jgi:hypothetical protein
VKVINREESESVINREESEYYLVSVVVLFYAVEVSKKKQFL